MRYRARPLSTSGTRGATNLSLATAPKRHLRAERFAHRDAAVSNIACALIEMCLIYQSIIFDGDDMILWRTTRG